MKISHSYLHLISFTGVLILFFIISAPVFAAAVGDRCESDRDCSDVGVLRGYCKIPSVIPDGCGEEGREACPIPRCEEKKAAGGDCERDAECAFGLSCTNKICGNAAGSSPPTGQTPVAPQIPGNSGTQPPSAPIVPRLQINIPGVSFSQPAQEGGYLTLPFLGDYIAGLYRYLIGIVGIVAGIMITVGGVQYLTSGGSPDRVSAAKERIKNSLIGLIIVFGSYVILFTINPELVSFSALKIKRVPQASLVLSELLTTTEVTSDPTEPAAPAPTFTECPVNLTTPFVPNLDVAGGRDPRTTEFKQKIITAITGSTPRERVVQLAEAAQKCGVSLGSCGLTVGLIYEMAGGISSVPRQGRGVHGINGTQASFLSSLYSSSLRSGCDTTCHRNAKSMVFNKFKTEIEGYPDSWLEDIEPGDSFIIFNSYPAPRGGHNVIFMGWESGGRARVVQGNWGKIVKGGTVCVKSTCPSPTPLMYVFKAEPPRQR